MFLASSLFETHLDLLALRELLLCPGEASDVLWVGWQLEHIDGVSPIGRGNGYLYRGRFGWSKIVKSCDYFRGVIVLEGERGGEVLELLHVLQLVGQQVVEGDECPEQLQRHFLDVALDFEVQVVAQGQVARDRVDGPVDLAKQVVLVGWG